MKLARAFLIDIFQNQQGRDISGARQQGAPGAETVFQPLVLGGNIISVVKGGMANDGDRPKVVGNGQYLHDPLLGDKAYPGVNGARPEIHKGGMKGNPQTGVPEFVGNKAIIGLTIGIQGIAVKTDFRIHPILKNPGKILFVKKMKRYMDLNFFQYRE